MTSISTENGNNKAGSVMPWPRIALSFIIGLAVQTLASVVYAILRYGPEFRTEMGDVWGQAAAVVLALPFICALGLRKMPATTTLSMITFVSILSNACGALGAYFFVYLADRGGLSL